MRAPLVAGCLVVLAFFAYTSNGEYVGSYDSAPNSVLVFTALETGRLDFDRLRGSPLVTSGARYAFTEAPDGHLSSIFPIGTAIVSAPIYLGFAALARAQGARLPPLGTAAFEPFRIGYEKLAAAIIAALSVGLFFACARLIAGREALLPAIVVTAVYAFGTSTWTIASQALWQHGPVNLCLLALIYAVLRAGRAAPAPSAAWLAAAGLAAGLLPVVRPTALLFTLAALLFVLTAERRRAGWFCAGLALGVAPGIAWNLVAFHALTGGYGPNAEAYIRDLPRAAGAFAALLVSPSRGLFIFSPVLLFALAGAVGAARRGGRDARLLLALAAACVALVVSYAFFLKWWGGFAYGPRFLSDTVAVAALLILYAFPARPLRAVIFALAAFASLVVQFAGANGGAAGSDWNFVPVSIDAAPARVWAWDDNQIERNVRAAYFRFAPPARAVAAEPVVAADVTALAPVLGHVTAGDQMLVRATVANDGPTRVYGYTTGRYTGQLRVRVRLIGPGERPVSEQYLYLAQTAAPGERRIATGLLRMPPVPGTYELRCDPMMVGGEVVRDPAPFRMTIVAE